MIISRLPLQCATDSPLRRTSAGQRGLALILVMFIVALASILVVNLTYSTYLGSRLGAASERAVQAEYLLKSALNAARAIIHSDETQEDSQKDAWGRFTNGVAIPPEMLGLNQPNLRMQLEIRPLDTKIPLGELVPTATGQVHIRWRDILARLFRKLGFDEDEEEDRDGKIYGAEEMVANLIDYMDPDKNSYDAPGFPAGIEGQLPEGTFPNIRIQRVGELAKIPGFTPYRIQQMIPFVHTFGRNRVNVNVAPRLVLHALDDKFDEEAVSAVVAYRESEDGPFTSIVKFNEIANVPELGIDPLLSTDSTWFEVLAKVDYGTSIHFLRSYVVKSPTPGAKDLPEIRSVELF